MSKERKSLFEVTASQKEISDAALQVQNETFEPRQIAENGAIKPTRNVQKEERPKHLYVSSEYHQQSKIHASIRGMKLREYIEWLIEQDKSQLKF